LVHPKKVLLEMTRNSPAKYLNCNDFAREAID